MPTSASVLRAFVIGCRAIDSYLSQARSLRALFVALNDGSVVVRALAIELIGARLSPKTPVLFASVERVLVAALGGTRKFD